MFPKVSDLINYLAGTHISLPFQTYGFIFAVAAVVAGFLIKSELKRKEIEGLLSAWKKITRPGKPLRWIEIIAGVMVSSILGWKFFGIIFQYRLFAENPQQYLISANGSLWALLVIAFVSLTYHIIKKKASKSAQDEAREEIIHPHQYTWNIMMIGLITSIIGSKLFDIIDNFGSFLRNPIHSLLSFSGLTFYGGFIVTVLALLLYMKVIKLNWKYVIDSIAPAIMIAYAIGRLGCHLSGDGCWGIINTMPQPHWLPGWLWASYYPHNVINQGVAITGCSGAHCMILEKPVFPTSLYESIISFISFGILWATRTRIKAPVVLFGLFMVLNGTERFLIEKIRINNRYDIFGMHVTQAEVISTLLILGGIAVILYFSKRYKAEN